MDTPLPLAYKVVLAIILGLWLGAAAAAVSTITAEHDDPRSVRWLPDGGFAL